MGLGYKWRGKNPLDLFISQLLDFKVLLWSFSFSFWRKPFLVYISVSAIWTDSLQHKREHREMPRMFFSFSSMTVPPTPLQTSDKPPFPKRSAWTLTFCSLSLSLPYLKYTHEYEVAWPGWGRQASSLFSVKLQRRFLAGGLDWMVGEGRCQCQPSSETWHFCLWREAMQNSLFSPSKDKRWINIFEAYV